jgi:hypothetical protein
MAHRGPKALRHLCERYNFYVPNLKELSSKVTTECEACIRGKSSYGGPPRGNLPKPSIPFTIMALDFLTINDSLKLLVMVDLTSGFIDSIPVSDMSGYTTLSAIKSLFYRWGFPSAILTDNGKSFMYDKLQSWLRSSGVKSLLTPLYSPQSNGACERAVRSVMESIRITFLSKRLSSIPIIDILPEILYGLNSIPKNKDSLAPRDYIFCFRERCPFVDNSNFPPSSKTFKGRFKTGDHILIKSTSTNLTKLEPRFDDEGVISSHIGNYIYQILLPNGKTVKFREDKLRLHPTSNEKQDEGGGL